MISTVEYVEVYPDGHEVVHHDFPLTKEISRCICKDDELTYERDADSIAAEHSPQVFVVSGWPCSPEDLHMESEIKFYSGIHISLHDGAEYHLTKIVHHVEQLDPPTTGLWLDRENNVVWFDYPHKYLLHASRRQWLRLAGRTGL